MELRPVATGLHALADLKVADDELVFREAMTRGVEVMPPSAYCFDRRAPPLRGFVLNFATVGPDLLGDGTQRLAASIDAAHHASRRRDPARRRRAAG